MHDLEIIQIVRNSIMRCQTAQRQLANYPQQHIAKIVAAMVRAGEKASEAAHICKT